MSRDDGQKPGSVRTLLDQFKINNRAIEDAVVKGLTGEGFDVEIEPDFRLGREGCSPMEGSTIKVYRSVINYV